MQIYCLTLIDSVDWDEFDGKVIVAQNEADARRIANKHTGTEGKVWEDTAFVKCEIVNTDKEGVVLESFCAG